jgi:MoaA/NifB/PqqE/SkfB family radical SAM enzyme
MSSWRLSKNKHMPIDLLQKITEDEYIRENHPTFSILMTEPLLSPNIGEYVRILRSKGYWARVTTNGFLLEKKAKELVDSNVSQIQVSIDGPSDLHDSIRGTGFYDHAIKGMKKMRELSPDTEILVNCTVSNLNYDRLLEFTKVLAREDVYIDLLKIQFMNFVSEKMAEEQSKTSIKQNVQSISDVIGPSFVNSEVLDSQIKEVKKFVETSQTIGRVKIYPDIDKETMNRYWDDRGLPIPNHDKCDYPFVEAAIKTDGTVLFHMRCFGYEIGNICDNKMRKIYHGARAKVFRKEFMKYDMCFPACTRCCGTLFG